MAVARRLKRLSIDHENDVTQLFFLRLSGAVY